MASGFTRRGSVALLLAGFLFFTLTGSRERPFSDATPIWEVADSIVRRGTVTIRTVWPPELERGRGGQVYALAPLLQSLVHVPGAWARWLLGKMIPASAPHSLPFFSHLAPAALGGLLLLGFFLLASRFVAPLAAALGTGTLALATFVWVYARSPYSEILQAACFLLFFAALLRARAAPTTGNAWLLGAAAGVLVASKLVHLAAVAGGTCWLVFLLYRHPAAPPAHRGPRAGPGTPGRGDRAWLGLVVGFVARVLAGALPFALLVALYNHARWGSPFLAGYLLAPAGRAAPFGESIPVGLWGLFLSPGKSVFLYSPPLLLGLLGLPRLRRKAPEVLGALLLTTLPVILVYSRFLFWAGDYAWGPRYLVFLAPLLMLPATVLLDGVLQLARGCRRHLGLGALGATALLGLAVQGLGVSFIWDHHIRITRDVGEAWLGRPNRAGAALPEREGLCGACFEDMHRLQWLPPFHPIDGHRWLLGHVARGDPWERAVQDAPWTRYTSIVFDISAAYRPVRLDWWFFELSSVNRPLALTLLLLLGAGTVFTISIFVRELNARRPAGK
jgi:hypothetical protein